MFTMNFKRAKGAEKPDFSEWGFGDGAIDKAITEELQDRIDVIFSDQGADIIVDLLLDKDSNDELIVSLDVCFERFEAHATGKVSLRDLLIDGMDIIDDEKLPVLANRLRGIADEISSDCQMEIGITGCIVKDLQVKENPFTGELTSLLSIAVDGDEDNNVAVFLHDDLTRELREKLKQGIRVHVSAVEKSTKATCNNDDVLVTKMLVANSLEIL